MQNKFLFAVFSILQMKIKPTDLKWEYLSDFLSFCLQAKINIAFFKIPFPSTS